MVKTIEPNKERQLLSTMKAAIKDTNDGVDPNVAIAKHANDSGLGPEFACRMVEAYNTSLTLKRLNSTSGEKRAESFPIASREEVLRHLYTPGLKEQSNEKTSYVRPHVGDVPDFNTVTPIIAEDSSVEKVAASLADEHKQAEVNAVPKYVDRSAIVTKATSMLDKIASVRRELKSDAQFAKEKVAAAAMDLTTALREPGAPDFEQIDAALAYRWGPLGKQAMDAVWALGPFEEFGEKRADAQRPALLRRSRRADMLAEQMMAALDKCAEANSAEVEFETVAIPAERWLKQQLVGLGHKKYANSDPAGTGKKQPRKGEREFAFEQTGKERERLIHSGQGDPVAEPLWRARRKLQIADQMHDPAKRKEYMQGVQARFDAEDAAQQRLREIEDKAERQQAEQQRKTDEVYGNLTDMVTGANLPFVPSWGPNMISDTPPEVGSIVDPVHDRELRAAQLQVLVNDMISNDEVISAYPPNEVIDAVNEATKIAPASATNPMLMRAVVSRLLQQRGHVDPSEVEQLLTTETKQRDLIDPSRRSQRKV
jgi:hypothetical protein